MAKKKATKRVYPKLNRDEENLLLYFDSVAVDHEGKIDSTKLNVDDEAILARWKETGFVDTGRIAMSGGGRGGRWVFLFDEAWDRIAGIRKRRAERAWTHRKWETTDELRERK